MSATVTTGRCAAAFRAQDGRIIYALYESMYEKNILPHNPDWGVVGIGEIQDVLRRIFGIASQCEGGMLQNRSGRITPEGYIRTWMQELANPLVQPDVFASISVGPYSSDPFDKEKRDEIAAKAGSLGMGNLLAEIDDGQKPVWSLHADTDKVLAFFGVNGVMPPWRFSRAGFMSPPYGDRDASLGYAPNRVRTPTLVDPVVLCVGETKFSGDPCLVRNEDGSFTESGWSYSVIGDFVEHLWKDELQFPGHYYSRIRNFRTYLKGLSPVPLTDLKVVVDTSLPFTGKLALYEEKRTTQFRTTHPVTNTATGFEFTPTDQNFLQATCLPKDRTRWWYLPQSEA